MSVSKLQKIADQLNSSNIGYDQGQRWSFLDRKRRAINKGGECDCSSSCGAIAWLAGYPVDLTGTFWTGNFAAKLKAAGFDVIRFQKLDQVKAGDFLVGPGHVIFARTKGKWWSAENDERGKSSGGKAGNQTGRETRYRAPYQRSKGWAYIVRPLSTATLKRRILAAYKTRQLGTVKSTLKLLTTRASSDGPRWKAFMAQWAAWDRGMPLDYDPATASVPAAGHAFVVLGSALTAKGAVTEKYRRRLALAKLAADTHPASKIVLTGGAAKSGVTEAAAGKAWLTAAGLDPARVLIETKSASTVGNALHTLPVLTTNKVTSYTLVSDASHLRRASVLFAAARLKEETANNKALKLTACRPLAYNDYAPDPVKPEAPVDDPTLATVVGQVTQLLGL